MYISIDNIESFEKKYGLLWEWAKDFGAMVIFLEHRYYGDSLPFGKHYFDVSFYFYINLFFINLHINI